MSKQKNKQFLLSYYESLIKSCKISLKVRDYQDFNKGLILRHDVDFSLDLAYEFSRIEKKYSKLSTYYILMTSDLYNPFSNESREIIKNMLEEGFEIGLHFDPTEYGDISGKELEKKFYNEIDIFESVFNFKIKSYSLHNPSIHGKYPNFRGIINAYNKDIFSDECYISDSMFSFHGKDPLEFIKKSKHQLIQFLTHPIHFFSDGNISYEKPMEIIINNYYKKFDKMFRVNKIYAEYGNEYQIKINEKL